MAKFVIECSRPGCGKYIQVSNSIFSKKNARCSCGELVNIKANRMMSRMCPHCGNNVVFDAAKGEKAKCPVCKNLINTTEQQSRTEEFSCAQCGIRLRADKNASTYRCPVCETVNDVQAQLAKERISKEGVASIIKYEGDNKTFIWKHPIEDFNLGSQVIVHESQEAIFFRDGQMLDTLGPGRHTLETQSVPFLERFYKLPTDGQKTFHAEVYFVNHTTQMGIKWGTDSRVRVHDMVNELYTEIGAGGEFNLKIVDGRRLMMKVVGTTGRLDQAQLFGTGGATGYFRALVMTEVKTTLAQIVRQERINLLDVAEELKRLGEGLKAAINYALKDYGLEMPEFYVTRVITPDRSEDPNFAEAQDQYNALGRNARQTNVVISERNVKLAEAQTEAQLKVLAAQAEAEAQRQQIQVEAEEMKLKGYTYQQETGRQVGLSATQNMGAMGGDGGGFGDLLGFGMAMGAMGSIADTTRQAMGGMQTPSMVPGTWKCACGAENTGKFCMECGKSKPQAQGIWKCSCGAENTGKFCMECGAPKPAAPERWKCACGAENTGKFCSECGAKKPETPEVWNCKCGNTGITGKFCTECGARKGE